MARRTLPRARTYHNTHAIVGRTRRARGDEQSPWWFPYLLGAAAVSIVAFVIVMVKSRGPEPDPHTLCAVGVQPPRHVLVVVGSNGPLTGAQYQATRSEILHRKESLEVGDLFTIVALTPNHEGRMHRHLFSKCRPRDHTEANWLFENPKLLKKHSLEHFEMPLEQAIKEIEAVGGTATLPLLASLRELFIMPSFRAVKQRTAILISDLLENSQELSQYSSSYSFSRLKQSRSINVMDVENALSGAQVLLLQLINEKTRRYQGEGHKQFWHEYLLFVGVPRYEIKGLYGWNCPAIVEEVTTLRQAGAWSSMETLVAQYLQEELPPTCHAQLLQEHYHALRAQAKQLPLKERITKLEEAVPVVQKLNLVAQDLQLDDTERHGLQQLLTAELQAARKELTANEAAKTIQTQDRILQHQTAHIRQLKSQVKDLKKLGK